MKKIIFAFILTVLFSSSAIAAETVPGDVLVIFKNPSENEVTTASLAADGENLAYVASVASEMDAEVKLAYDTLSENNNELFVLVHSDTKSEQELLEELLARPDVKGASLNYINYPASKTPNDRYYDKLWGMEAINAPSVWENTTGSDSVYVAVIDTGIDTAHEDLQGNIATEYCKAWNANGDVINVISDYSDISTEGHGTHISGIIGAAGNNEKGVAGVNWRTKVIMLKAYMTIITPEGKESTGFFDAVTILALQEVKRLKDNGVNIAALNMSLGGWRDRGGSPAQISNSKNPYWAALKAVSDAGVILCIAAGNENQAVGEPAPCDDYSGNGEYNKGDYIYPASFLNIPNMLVVAAASKDVNGKIIRSAEGTDESRSNYSSKYVHVAAPGSHIISTTPNDYEIEIFSESERVEEGVRNYANWPGTSVAAPHVAGTVALLKAAYPNAAASQIKKAILDGADGNYCKNDADEITYSKGEHIKDNTSKYGFLDVKGAYDELESIIEIQTEPSKSDYTVTTDVDSKYFASSSSSSWRAVTIQIADKNGNKPAAGDVFYVWLNQASSSSVKTAADSTPYVAYVKTAGELEINLDDNLFENDGETKADITAGTYSIKYRSENGNFVGTTSAVKLASTSGSSSSESTTGGSGGGCELMRSEKLEIRNVLILCAFILLSFGAIKIKRS